MRKTLIVLSCFAALMLTACTGDSSRPQKTGEGVIRSINAISTSPAFLFLIEERSISSVVYSGMSTQLEFDDLEYLFNFELTLPGDTLRSRVASTLVNVVKDTQYTLVISGDVDAPLVTVWEKPVREWAETETVLEVRFAHTAESLGPIDVYFAAPGTAPVAGAEIGTLAFGEILPVADYTSGDYVYTVTSAGNPGDILFTSTTISTVPATGFLISVFDGTANDPGEYAYKVFTDDGSSGDLTSDDISPTVRFIHANATVGNADVYTDNTLMNQILANHAYRDVTGDIELASGIYDVTYTAAGNPGSILTEDTLLVPGSAHSQIYLFGTDTVLNSALRVPDRRSVETQVKFTFVHASINHPLIDLYIVEAGTDIEDALPTYIQLTTGAIPNATNPDPGDLEIYMTVSGEKTVITGPVPFTAALGDVFEYIAYDNVDPATADLVAIPLP